MDKTLLGISISLFDSELEVKDIVVIQIQTRKDDTHLSQSERISLCSDKLWTDITR